MKYKLELTLQELEVIHDLLQENSQALSCADGESIEAQQDLVDRLADEIGDILYVEGDTHALS